MSQALFEFVRPVNDWKPEAPPDLTPGEWIGFDFEYKPGSNPTKDKPIAYSLWRPQMRRGWYVPWGHQGGGNLDEDVCRRWAEDNLLDRNIVGLNMKAELHQLYNWKLDPERLHIKPHDVAFNAALLNEYRLGGFSLEALSAEYLPAGERKVKPLAVDPDKFYLAHAGELAERGISDSFLAWKIHEVTLPQIKREEQERALQLENDIILAVVNMERTGALLDREKLERWDHEIDEKISTIFMMIYRATGVPCYPNKRDSMLDLFKKLGISVELATAWNDKKNCYEQNFSEAALLNVIKKTKSRMIDLALQLRQWSSMKAKYTHKYLMKMDSKNVLHYTLHQLRSGTDETDSMGTASGRFSCGGSYRDYKDVQGINTQQVVKAETNVEEFGNDVVIREAFIPEPGKKMAASDASQIEFRLFACYANAQGIIDAYAKDPMMDFHLLVTRVMMPQFKDDPDRLAEERKNRKHQNFGKLYGLGKAKLARKLNMDCRCDRNWSHFSAGKWDDTGLKFSNNDDHDSECLARQANDIADEYDRLFPEAGELLDKTTDAAKARGWVKTIFGRRAHFDSRNPRNRPYSALNRIVQGSAADIFKMKLKELFDRRRELGITVRMPVHDEFVYDIEDPTKIGLVQELLDTQSIKLKVPILWETDLGDNWKEANLPPKKLAKAIKAFERRQAEKENTLR